MNEPIKIHEHGYVTLIEAWGSDERIVETARVSTQKGFLGWGPKEDGSPGDEKLLSYLWTNQHSTPFEFGGLTIEVQAPIFVFREWIRHRNQSFSEASARYAPLPDLNYVPTYNRIKNGGAHTTNKQSSGGALSHDETIETIEIIAAQYDAAELAYQHMLSIGVAKELARIVLPVGRYSKMRASTDLRNWLAFERLRLAPGAQEEIRVYAEAVGTLISQAFPRTWALFQSSVSK